MHLICHSDSDFFFVTFIVENSKKYHSIIGDGGFDKRRGDEGLLTMTQMYKTP